MQLMKQIKQSIISYNFSRCKKTCGKPKLLAQILVCWLAVNYVGSAGATTACEIATSIQHDFNATLPDIVAKGASEISADNLKKGKVTIDPAVLELKSSAFGSTLQHGHRQSLGSNDIYEYISNHENKATIGENSSIYFGLTPANDGSGQPTHYLASFEYRSTTTNPAVTIELNKLKAKLTNNSLKSIVICSTVDSGNVGNAVNNALKVTGESSITLTDGLIIAKSAKLLGGYSTKGPSLVLQDGSLTADIINYGEIQGYDGVKIENFWLTSPSGGAAKFYNHGKILMEADSENAFLINATSIGNDANAFELINCKDGKITGRLRLGNNNKAEFNVINYGVITANLAEKTTHNINSYKGKPFSKLILEFPGNQKQSYPIIHCANDFTLETNAWIVLATSTSNLPQDKHTIVKCASGTVRLAGDVNDFLYTSIVEGSKYIEATTIKLDDKTIEVTLKTVAKPKSLPTTYMPDMVKAANATQHIHEAITTATAIDKAISTNQIEIAGIDLKSKIEDLKKSNMFDKARNYCSSADEFFDILLPDSSNSQLIANYKLANKLIAQVSARIASKSMSIAKARVNKIFADRGANSCEASNNISAWTSFNYLHSEAKANSDKQSYSKLQARVFSLGVDSQLAYRNLTLGASYGFASLANKIYGGSSGKNSNNITPDENIKTHAFTLYSAIHINKVDAHFAMSLGFSKHETKEEIAEKYHSSMLSFHSLVAYLIDVEYVNLDIIGSFGGNIIHTDEHDNKFSIKQTPKKDHNLIYLGLMLAITDVINLNNALNLDYKIGLGGKYTISRDNKSNIAVATDVKTGANISIDYKKRPVSPCEFNIYANLNLQVQQNIHVGLAVNFDRGEDSNDFDISTSFRYLF